MDYFFNNIWNKSKEFNFDSLNTLRYKTIVVISIIYISITLFITVMRILNQELVLPVINFFGIGLISLSLYSALKGKLNFAAFTSCFVITALGFALPYFKLVPPKLILPQLTLIISIFTLVINTKKKRLIYLIICIFLFGILCFELGLTIIQSLMFIVQVFGCITAFYLFSDQLSISDSRLNYALSATQVAHNEKKNLIVLLEQQNDDLRTFSHIMSHDLKAPIRTINSFVGLIRKKETFQDGSTDEYFNMIQSSANKINSIINDLLLLQSLNSKKLVFEKIDINNILDNILLQYQLEIKSKKLIIDVDVIPDIYGSKALIETLFRNLIGNGIKYQPFDKFHLPTIVVTGTKKKDNIEVIVSDNGIGIKKEFIDHIFVPFKRLHSESKYTGTGLGLSICKRVMEIHKGNISILESDKQGTSFLLEFQKPTANII